MGDDLGVERLQVEVEIEHADHVRRSRRSAGSGAACSRLKCACSADRLGRLAALGAEIARSARTRPAGYRRSPRRARRAGARGWRARAPAASLSRNIRLAAALSASTRAITRVLLSSASALITRLPRVITSASRPHREAERSLIDPAQLLAERSCGGRGRGRAGSLLLARLRSGARARPCPRRWPLALCHLHTLTPLPLPPHPHPRLSSQTSHSHHLSPHPASPFPLHPRRGPNNTPSHVKVN